MDYSFEIFIILWLHSFLLIVFHVIIIIKTKVLLPQSTVDDFGYSV